ncbi:unnamed protein product [Coccothraustes coccothraustes]
MAPRPTAALRLLPGSCGWHPNEEPLEEARQTSEAKVTLSSVHVCLFISAENEAEGISDLVNKRTSGQKEDLQ